MISLYETQVSDQPYARLTTGSPYLYTPAYHVALPALQVGDILVASAECEVTNSHAYMTLAGAWLAFIRGNGDYGVAMSGVNADDLAPQTHGRITKVGTYLVDQAYAAGTDVLLWVYGASTLAQPGDVLTIEQGGYGKLSVLLVRN